MCRAVCLSQVGPRRSNLSPLADFEFLYKQEMKPKVEVYIIARALKMSQHMPRATWQSLGDSLVQNI